MKDGGPAFPMHGNEFHNGTEGMTLRDWFAGQALEFVSNATPEETASECYAIADAMLAARERGEDTP